MKIIQTLWSSELNCNQINGGWTHPVYHWFSWALSCLQLRKYYNCVELYTTESIATFVTDVLRLPYTRVHILPKEINEIPAMFWAGAKVLTYSAQTDPFLHVDGDVYIWERFSAEVEKAALVAQNKEVNSQYYADLLPLINERFNFVPSVLQLTNYRLNFNSCNAGILGGNNVDFLKKYSLEALRFLKENLLQLEKFSITDFNTMFEQYLFFQMASNELIPVTFLLKDEINNLTYQGLANFEEVPYDAKYVHALAGYKTNIYVCNHLAKRLRQDYPEYYYLIVKLCKDTADFPLHYYTIKSSKAKGKINVNQYTDICKIVDKLEDAIVVNSRINNLRYLSKSTNNKKLKDAIKLKEKYNYFTLKNFNLSKLYTKEINQYYLAEKTFSDKNYAKSLMVLRRNNNVRLSVNKWPWPLVYEIENLEHWLNPQPSYYQFALVPCILSMNW